eukprot:scaffold35425_cov167-Skeletonema_dohrnii-CCMP3373.AAC.2
MSVVAYANQLRANRIWYIPNSFCFCEEGKAPLCHAFFHHRQTAEEEDGNARQRLEKGCIEFSECK